MFDALVTKLNERASKRSESLRQQYDKLNDAQKADMLRKLSEQIDELQRNGDTKLYHVGNGSYRSYAIVLNKLAALCCIEGIDLDIKNFKVLQPA